MSLKLSHPKTSPSLHHTETEKYAHVTFFFNGGREVQFDKETRELIPSPKVATYDLAPPMSVAAVGDAVCAKVKEGAAEFVMCNLAPPDMVGHTGVYEATVVAVKETDIAIGKIAAACEEAGYTLFVTSDHGNAEKMLDTTKEPPTPHTAHTCNPVPLTMIIPSSAKGSATATLKKAAQSDKCDVPISGSLCDVAPTILDWMGIDLPAEMDGASLLVRA